MRRPGLARPWPSRTIVNGHEVSGPTEPPHHIRPKAEGHEMTEAVALDCVDISDLNLAWLRRQIGVVSQEPALLGWPFRLRRS